MLRNNRVQGIFILHLIYLFIFPSESPVSDPPPSTCSLIGSPCAAILRYQSHWSTFHSFIHSCTSAGVPKKGPSYVLIGKNIRSPSTEPHAGGQRTKKGVQLGSPRRSLRHCFLHPSVMQPSARYLPPSIG